MDNDEVIRQVFEAFSTLSDAQELVQGNSNVIETINHAKRHLLWVLEVDKEATARALIAITMALECSLEKKGGSY